MAVSVTAARLRIIRLDQPVEIDNSYQRKQVFDVMLQCAEELAAQLQCRVIEMVPWTTAAAEEFGRDYYFQQVPAQDTRSKRLRGMVLLERAL